MARTTHPGAVSSPLCSLMGTQHGTHRQEARGTDLQLVQPFLAGLRYHGFKVSSPHLQLQSFRHKCDLPLTWS